MTHFVCFVSFVVIFTPMHVVSFELRGVQLVGRRSLRDLVPPYEIS